MKTTKTPNSIQDIANTLRRHNSWDTQPTQPASAVRLTPKGSADNANAKRLTSSTLKYSTSATSKPATPIPSKSASPELEVELERDQKPESEQNRPMPSSLDISKESTSKPTPFVE